MFLQKAQYATGMDIGFTEEQMHDKLVQIKPPSRAWNGDTQLLCYIEKAI